MNRLLNEKEAAQYLEITLVELRQLRKQRQIRCYESGSGTIYSIKKHLEPFLKKNRKKGH